MLETNESTNRPSNPDARLKSNRDSAMALKHAQRMQTERDRQGPIVRGLWTVLAAPFHAVDAAARSTPGRAIIRAVWSPVRRYNERNYKRPPTGDEMRAMWRTSSPARQVNVPGQQRAEWVGWRAPRATNKPRPSIGQRVRSTIGHIVRSPMYAVGAVAGAVERIPSMVSRGVSRVGSLFRRRR